MTIKSCSENASGSVFDLVPSEHLVQLTFVEAGLLIDTSKKNSETGIMASGDSAWKLDLHLCLLKARNSSVDSESLSYSSFFKYWPSAVSLFS